MSPTTDASTAPSCEYDPSADFQGDVNVSKALPTKKEVQQCDDILVFDAQGQSRPFKDLHSGEGVAARQLIIFVRHFFCGNCQEYLRSLTQSITTDDLLSLETPTFITIIGCGRPELISMYTDTTECPFPIYADPTRKLYDTLGMTRTFELGSKPDYIQKSIFYTTVASIMQGLKSGQHALKGGDFKQIGGEFLFENGEVTWCHRMRNTRDHAEIPDLRKVIGLDLEKPTPKKRWSAGLQKLTQKGRSRSSSSSFGKKLEERKERRRSRSNSKTGGNKAPEMEEKKALLGPPMSPPLERPSAERFSRDSRPSEDVRPSADFEKSVAPA